MNFRCLGPDFDKFKVDDDGLPTESQVEQSDVEYSIGQCYSYFKSRNSTELEVGTPELTRDRHVMFLQKGLQNLSESYACLDASRPWIVYWIVHSLELLDSPIPPHLISWIVKFLGKCQCPTGGFAGGPGQYAHLAPTYAAVNALCILDNEEAYNVINRPKLQEFLMRMHQPDGSFVMQDGGEVDIRGVYCAASAARLTNIYKAAMFEDTPDWIVRCQTYEGGFAGEPGVEAHGGYSFCGLAALILLGAEEKCNLKALLRWTTQRQMSFEGGFQGRTNKLVDGCYSFWQGGAFPLLHMVLSKCGDNCLSAERWMFHQEALQEYLLICCQHVAGGLIDKPGKPRDYYHTCYCLSGLSVAQHFIGGKLEHDIVLGNPDNELKPTHPVYNLCLDKVIHANRFFNNLSVPTTEEEKSSV